LVGRLVAGEGLVAPRYVRIVATNLGQEITMVSIRRAGFPTDIPTVLNIWREFIANSPVNLDYQNNEVEFSTFADKYAAPKGCVLLAELEGATVGCVAMREVTQAICEMKRMYVRQDARGKRIGRELAERLIQEARASGYREMRLDVQEKSLSARKLYADLGFVPAEPISFNPVEGASFLGLHL
jgi:putative acetyltransferase